MELTFYEVTLKKLALVSSALAFWRKDDIQLKLMQFHYPYFRCGKKEFLVILIKEVMKKVDSDCLPAVLYSELLLAIKDMGFKMSNWFFYIRRRKAFRNIPRKELYDKFLKDVYFTHYGTIDEMKILKLSWMKVPDVDYVVLYIMACYYCSEELINELWRKICAHNLQFYSYEHLCKRFGFHLVAYWNKLRENDLDKFYNDCIVPNVGNIYDDTQSAEVNLLRLSVGKGYVQAVKYFGAKISKEDMERNVEFCLSFIFDMSNEIDKSQFYRKEQYTEIALYLLQFLTEKTKKIVFTELNMSNSLVLPRDEVKYMKQFLNMFIKMWPWQGCFEFVLNSVKNLLDEEHFKWLFVSVIKNLASSSDFGVPPESSIFQRLLHKLWYSVPDGWKSSMVDDYSLQLLFNCDLRSCKLILNNKQIIEQKGKKIDMLLKHYVRNSKLEKKEELQMFISKVLLLSDCNDNDENTSKIFYDHIMDGDLDSVNKQVDGASPEDFETKYEILKFAKTNSIEKAEKLLRWAFSDSEQEKIAFMRELWTASEWDKEHGENSQMVLMCKLFIGKYWHYDIFSPQPTREEVAESFKKFIRFFIKPYLDNIDDLKRILKSWPEESENTFEVIDDDDPSTTEYYSEHSEDYEDSEYFMYCEKENCQLFLKLLENEYE